MKKIFFLTLLAMFLVSLSSCEKIKESDSENIQSSLDVIALLPLTGPAASLGEYLKNGLQLGQATVDKKFEDQIHINLRIVDTKSKPKNGIDALRSAMLINKPDAVITALSSVSSAIKPIVDQEGIATIATTTSLSGLPQNSSVIVRFYPTSDDFIPLVTKYIADKYKYPAVLYINDDFGHANQQLFLNIMKTKSITVVTSQPYEFLPKDIHSLIAKVVSLSPDCIFLTGYGPSFIAVAKKIRETNPDVALVAGIGFSNPTVLNSLGKVAEGVVFVGTDVDLSEPTLRESNEFAVKYRLLFGASTYHVAAYAHDAIVALAKAAMTEKSTTSITKTDMIKASPYSGVVGTIYLDNFGEHKSTLYLMENKEGKNVKIAQHVFQN
ncbi:MAG: hypothetical protein BA862_06660 [Desulfobulbaceae bacterium S3730MH12]|nr:MAG: hypothetical protein BA862_06660 [Desulfobulbaceae bacterium S3730MH12]